MKEEGISAKILVVDDDDFIRLTFDAVLTNEGYKIFTAKNVATAIDIIKKTDIDLIYADIMLEEETGLDILRIINEKHLSSPVIMITGQPEIETATQALRYGAFDYLTKPMFKETIIHSTSRALKHKSLLDDKSKLEVEKERYRCNLEAIFNSVEDAIVTVDHKMKIIKANDAIKRICGLHPAEITEKDFSHVASLCPQPCTQVLKETLKSKKIIREYRIECKHKQQSRQVVVLNSSPLLDNSNQFVGAVLVIRDITKLADLEQELRDRHQFHQIIGKSQKMQEVYRIIENLAETETTVLITGESGTGKELVGKALHYSGVRAFGPYIQVNCSALAENLLESELFGHVKGAFTGAVKDKCGRFEAASGGTILLDEIGDMSPRIQLKLLRVLQEKEFERVGESTTLKLNARVITATNSNLREKMRLGEFREDLYYRLKVVEINLPPLRERIEDVPLLCQCFIDTFNKTYKKNILGISNEVLSVFMNCSWHGNVRELKHAIEHAFVLCNEPYLRIEHLPSEFSENMHYEEIQRETLSDQIPTNIRYALEKAGWNKAKAARILGISRQTIYRKIKEYRLSE